MQKTEQLAEFIEWWLSAYEILARFNTPANLLHIIASIEHTEFTDEYARHAERDPASHYILDEVADLVMLSLQLFHQLGDEIHPIIESAVVSAVTSVPQAKAQIDTAALQLRTKSSEQQSDWEQIKAETIALLQGVASYCAVLGLSWLDVTLAKAEYLEDAMPVEIWTAEYIWRNHDPSAKSPKALFDTARRVSKQHQMKNCPKNPHLFARFSRLQPARM